MTATAHATGPSPATTLGTPLDPPTPTSLVFGRPARDGSQSPVARRILDAATPLFYGQGIRAVSAEVILEAAGVTKATFYRHFPTKDHLVTAYLLALVEGEKSAVARWRAEHPNDPAAVLRAYAHALGAEVCRPGFRGCPFLNATAEYPALDHRVRAAVAVHREWLRRTADELLDQLGVRDHATVATALIMLRDGAMVAGEGGGAQDVVDTLLTAGGALIRAGLPA